MNWKENYKYWIENAPKEIVEIITDLPEEQKEINFTGDLQFGTAGVRGVMGYGTAVLNEFLLAKFTLAYGKSILKKYGNSARRQGVIIAHDNRRNGILFSETAAQVLSALGIPVFLFNDNELQPTPLLSYTISKGNYIGGMNITASHNPPSYNGFKLYDHSGTQLLPDDTDEILKFAKEDVDIFKIEKNKDKIQYLSESVVYQYIDSIMGLIPFEPYNEKKELKVVFTAQHGTAGKIAKEIMTRSNVEHFFVEDQMIPDENFSNTVSANPQDRSAFIKARELGDKVGADVVFSTDPDADRFGIEVKHKGEWVHLDGNELALIQLSYKLRKLKEIDYLHHGDFVVKSVVTSKAGELIARKYGVHVYDTLTGFKWIINEAFKHELQGNECLFAWEESYGSTIRTFTKDKDAFQALFQVIEMSEEYKKKGKTLINVLESIYEVIGYWYSPQEQIKFEGVNPMGQMNDVVEKVRHFNIGDSVGKYKITDIIDFAEGYNGMHPENFVQLIIEEDFRITVRPSGTEPILRVYFDIVSDSHQKSREIFKELKDFVDHLKD